MKSRRLAVCIPTYNRSEIILEFIEKHIERYLKYGFDIFVYDSSENSDTENIVKKGTGQYKSLHFVKIDPSVHSNMKVYNIFKEFGEKLDYEYLWICGDAVSWSDRVLESVNICINQGYDMIIPNHHDVEKLGDKIYTNVNRFFLDCAWQMTYYGTTIVKVSTVLTDVDWPYLIKKYAVPDSINLSHVAFYFEKISTMRVWRGVHLSFAESDIIVSSLKKSSGWKQDTFYIWCYCWPTMINRLPQCYTNKKKVIRKNGANSLILSYNNLKVLRSENIFNSEIYKQYKNKWHNLTTVPQLSLWFLSTLPPEAALDIRGYLKEMQIKNRIKKFCNRFERIYIYGAGLKAKRYTRYLNEMGLGFEAYMVTGDVDGTETIEGHKVIKFSRDVLNDRKAGLLLALNKENTKEVMKSTLRRVKNRVIFSEFILWRFM